VTGRRPILLVSAGALLAGRLRAQQQTLGASLRPPDAWSSPTTHFNPTNMQIGQSFGRIALGGDAATGARPLSRLQRFRMPMRILAVGEDAPRYAPMLRRHLDELSRLTGQVFTRPDGAPPNLVCVLSPDPRRFIGAEPQRAEFLRLLGSQRWLDAVLDMIVPGTVGTFHTFVSASRAPEIVAAFMVIPTDAHPVLIRAAITEEFSQVLGLVGDDPRVGWSVFSDHSPYADLTDQDRWMLRTLFQPAIVPGLSLRDATAAATDAMRRLRPGDMAAGSMHPADDPDDEAVVEAFLRLAFGPRPGGVRRTRLARWEGRVRVRIVTDPGSEGYGSYALEHLAHLAFITRHAFDLVSDRTANLLIVLARDPAAAIAAVDIPMPQTAPSRGPPGTSEHGAHLLAYADEARTRIAAGLCVIRAAAPTLIWHAMVHHLSAMLGDLAAPAGMAGTVFGADSPWTDLTALDRRVLRLLHLSALQPGQTAVEARAAARQAVALSRLAP
jgi:hypothetical protein